LIDGRHFSDAIYVKARTGANIDSDYMLVVIKLRYRISRFAVERVNDGHVATMYRHELEAELWDASKPEPQNLNDKWERMEEAVRKVAKNTIGYTRNQQEKSASTRSAKRRTRRRTLVERMSSTDEREQQKTNIDKPDRKRGTCSKRSQGNLTRRL
jgi:hypothetical protein